MIIYVYLLVFFWIVGEIKVKFDANADLLKRC